MSKENPKSLRALEVVMLDDSDLSTSELRAELEAQGVDVDAFLARFSTTVRTSVQRKTKLAAQTARQAASKKSTRRFGDLVNKPLTELREMFVRICAGEFGVGSQQAALARCRNLQSDIPSEAELRSWLEDISMLDDQ